MLLFSEIETAKIETAIESFHNGENFTDITEEEFDDMDLDSYDDCVWVNSTCIVVWDVNEKCYCRVML